MEILKWVLYSIMAGLALFAIFSIGRAAFRATVNLKDKTRHTIGRTILVVVAVLIIVSLITFTKDDYIRTGIKTLTLTKDVENLGGIVGAICSSLFFQIFGITAFFIPALLLAWGTIKSKYYESLSLRTVSILGIAIFFSVLLSIPPIKNPFPFPIGGIVGKSLSQFFLKWLGSAGTWLILGISFFGLVASFPLFRNVVRHRKRKPPTAVKPKPKKIKVPPSAPLISEIHALLERDLGSFNERYLSILKNPPKFEESYDTKMGRERSELLEKRFEEFGVTGRVANVSPGPVITRYEYEPAPGIKVSKIASLSNDLALSMKSSRIRIVAPIPGRSAIGIEVPNHMRRDVYLKEILNSESFTNSRSKLTVAMGVNIVGEPISSDIQQMPHLLIAGATGSGKSVFINAMIASILLRALPEEVRFIMIDPKRIELPVYNGIPHLIRPVISDAKEALSALKDIIGWMDLRYREFARAGVRDIDGYNVKVEKRKPYILIIVDELADLMLMAPSDIEETLTRLAQMSRAVGIHLILATQRPSVDVITGLIKANFPARVAFQVASKTDSRTILDMNGAEKLLGRGDMLFLPPGKGVPERLHGAYISTDEAKGIANLWEERWLSSLLKDKIERAELISRLIVERDIIDAIVIPDLPGAKERLARFVSMAEEKTGISARTIAEVITSVEYYAPLDEQFSTKEEGMREERKEYEEFDELFEDAKRLVVRHQVASVSLLQRHFKIGYARAGRIIDQLERAGAIGPYVGSKAREVMIPREEDQSLKIKN